MNILAVLKRLLAGVCATALAFSPAGYAQTGAPAQSQFTQPELDQMLAPIALYPDSLLSQILMASTYPLEVVEAARWSRAHPGLQGDQAVREAQRQDWDPSVTSLVAFPQILTMMDERLDWTKRLGDAFLDAEAQVMDTVQSLRERAYAAGSLRSSEYLQVERQADFISLEPAHPHVVHVPYYSPVEVYGPWWWPAYPPVSWAPWPGYHARPARVAAFAWGHGISISAAFFFGGFDWHRRHARVIHVNNYYYNRSAIIHRRADGAAARSAHPAPDRWRHDPRHRRGAGYREASLRGPAGAGQTIDAQRAARLRDASPPAAINQSIPPQGLRRDTGARERTGAVREADSRADGLEQRRHPGERRDLRRDHRSSADELDAPLAQGSPRSVAATAGASPARETDTHRAERQALSSPGDARRGHLAFQAQEPASSAVGKPAGTMGNNARPGAILSAVQSGPAVPVPPRASAPAATNAPFIRHAPAVAAAQRPPSPMAVDVGPAHARISAGHPSVVPDRARMVAPHAGAGRLPGGAGPVRDSVQRASRDAPAIVHKTHPH